MIRRMSLENPLWGAPRIHGELLKLGVAVAPSKRQQVYGEERNDYPCPVRARLPSCATVRRRLRPWTCLSCRLLGLTALRLNYCPAGAARAGLDQRNGASDSRMDRAADYRGLSLERGAAVSNPRPGSNPWHRCQTPASGNGDPRQADFGRIAMAKLFYRTADRLHPARMH